MKVKLVPRRSLRTILMLWFLLFSIVPLAFLTGYSLVKYAQALDQELGHRLGANIREVTSLVKEFESILVTESKQLSSDRKLGYYLATNNYSQARQIVEQWIGNHYAHNVWVWSAEGRLEIAYFRNEQGEIERLHRMEGGDVYLSDLKTLQKGEVLLDLDIQPTQLKKRDGASGVVELMVFSPIRSTNGKISGYLQQVVNLDEGFLKSIKSRLGVELILFRSDQEKTVATHEDLSAYNPDFFQKKNDLENLFDLNIRGEPFRFTQDGLKWGGSELRIVLGASKKVAITVLKNVQYAFISVFAVVLVLLVILSIVMSRILLRPIYEVLDGIQNLDSDKDLKLIPINNNTEIGLLAESFNEMAQRTIESQKALKGKVRELEKANEEIKNTQAKLVHTAKMASLGQLVAGVAHELNNPIGFIYSNLGVLRDYSGRLFNMIEYLRSKESLQKGDDEDYEYIKKDLPKLITSCEDGARRTKDIVLGLRNFSRLDEAQIKEVDIHDGIESTLQLLTGETKNRIKVHTNFGDLPKVTCYASQINQVFMNILSNAAQAIEGNGEIFIVTRKVNKEKVSISIRDTGRGMDKETMTQVFDPFFTTKAQGSGTGLGLSISYGVVQKHGGDIQVHSKVGHGTEFIITLPIKESSLHNEGV